MGVLNHPFSVPPSRRGVGGNNHTSNSSGVGGEEGGDTTAMKRKLVEGDEEENRRQQMNPYASGGGDLANPFYKKRPHPGAGNRTGEEGDGHSNSVYGGRGYVVGDSHKGGSVHGLQGQGGGREAERDSVSASQPTPNVVHFASSSRDTRHHQHGSPSPTPSYTGPQVTSTGTSSSGTPHQRQSCWNSSCLPRPNVSPSSRDPTMMMMTGSMGGGVSGDSAPPPPPPAYHGVTSRTVMPPHSLHQASATALAHPGWGQGGGGESQNSCNSKGPFWMSPHDGGGGRGGDGMGPSPMSRAVSSSTGLALGGGGGRHQAYSPYPPSLPPSAAAHTLEGGTGGDSSRSRGDSRGDSSVGMAQQGRMGSAGVVGGERVYLDSHLKGLHSSTASNASMLGGGAMGGRAGDLMADD